MGSFSLFGIGEGGLPGEVDHWLEQPGEVERLATHIVEECEAKSRSALNRTRRPRPSVEIASEAFLLVQWHRKHARPIPPLVMDALAHALGLVSYAGGGVTNEAPRSAVSDHLKARIGLPVSVEMFRMDAFWHAARLDGEADGVGKVRLKREVLAEALGVSPRSIDAWRKERLYRARRGALAVWGAAKVEPLPRSEEEQLAWVTNRMSSWT